MLASYPHSRATSSTAAIYGGNRRRGGAIAHRDGGIIHGGWHHRPDRWIPGPLHAQVNPTGGSPGGPPTLPPIGPSCAGTGYHYQSRGPRAQSRIGGCLGPFMRRLTPQVVAQAGRPHCHLSGPAAQERVKATSKRAHAHTSLPPLRGQRAVTTQKSHVISFGQFSLAP